MTRASLAVAMAVALSAQSALPTGRDVDGREWALLAPDRGDVHVVVFVSTDCPISNRYAPELARLQTDYAARRVRLFLVYEDPVLDAKNVKTHLGEFYPGATLPAFADRDHALARHAGAKTTPTAVIYSADGRKYRGRIDDLYVALGKSRREPTERTLRLSLDAVLAGRAVPAPETTAVGCSIGGEK